MGNRQAITSQNLDRKGNAHVCVGASSMQGKRHNMEDEHRIVLQLGDHKECSFFGVFDGHGGNKDNAASRMLSQKVHKRMQDLDLFTDSNIRKCVLDLDSQFLKNSPCAEHGSTAVFSIVQEAEHVKGGLFEATKLQKKISQASGVLIPAEILSSCIKHQTSQCSRDILEILGSDCSLEESKHEGGRKEYLVTVANVGDSRAILGRSDGSIEILTSDHNTKERFEHNRVINSKGKVNKENRIEIEGNSLAVSRSFGDAFFKKSQPGKGPLHQQVIALPDVTRTIAAPGDWLLFCCDGLFEKLSDHRVCEIVAKGLDKFFDPARVLFELLRISLEEGSTDNMTAVLVWFDDGTDYNFEKSLFIPGPCFDEIDNSQWIDAYKSDASKRGNIDSEKLLFLCAYATEFQQCDEKETLDKKIQLASALVKYSRDLSISDFSVFTNSHMKYPVLNTNDVRALMDGGKRMNIQDLRKLFHGDPHGLKLLNIEDTVKKQVEDCLQAIASYWLFHVKKADSSKPTFGLPAWLWDIFEASKISQSEFLYIWESLEHQGFAELDVFRNLEKSDLRDLRIRPSAGEHILKLGKKLRVDRFKLILKRYMKLHKCTSQENVVLKWIEEHGYLDNEFRAFGASHAFEFVEDLRKDYQIAEAVVLAVDELDEKVTAQRAHAFTKGGHFEFKTNDLPMYRTSIKGVISEVDGRCDIQVKDVWYGAKIIETRTSVSGKELKVKLIHQTSMWNSDMYWVSLRRACTCENICHELLHDVARFRSQNKKTLEMGDFVNQSDGTKNYIAFVKERKGEKAELFFKYTSGSVKGWGSELCSIDSITYRQGHFDNIQNQVVIENSTPIIEVINLIWNVDATYSTGEVITRPYYEQVVNMFTNSQCKTLDDLKGVMNRNDFPSKKGEHARFAKEIFIQFFEDQRLLGKKVDAADPDALKIFTQRISLKREQLNRSN